MVQEISYGYSGYTESLGELRNLESRKDWSRLEVCAKQILAKCSVSVNAMMALGKALEKQKKIDEAVGCYEDAIAVLRTRRTPQSHFMKRLDILYRRLKKYEDCFQVCLYYADEFSYSPDAVHRLARAANLVGKNDLRNAAQALEKRVKEPIVPRGKPLPALSELSDEELENLLTITDDDIQGAIDHWNRTFPELAGLLEATPYTGDIDELVGSSEFEDEETYLRVETKPRPRYSDDDINRISKALSERLGR